MSQTELERAVGEVLIDEDTLPTRVAELGAEVSADYEGRDLLLIGVLKGAVFFMADLMRHITVPCEVDFMAISSYGDSTDTSGIVRILKDLDINIEGRDVLVVEDIIDSGLTLSYLMRNLESREPAIARGLRAADQAVAPRDRRSGALRRLRDPEQASWSATASTSPSATGTCRTSAYSTSTCSPTRFRPTPIRETVTLMPAGTLCR